MSLRTKSYDVTIEMKAFCLYLNGTICFSKFYKRKFGNLVEICLWLHLAAKGLKQSTKKKNHKKLISATAFRQ